VVAVGLVSLKNSFAYQYAQQRAREAKRGRAAGRYLGKIVGGVQSSLEMRLWLAALLRWVGWALSGPRSAASRMCAAVSTGASVGTAPHERTSP
jgi:hypothetical protein